MSELTTIPQAIEPHVVTQLGGGDVLVIAETPGQMQTAQQALIDWATQKVVQVKQELAEAEKSYDQAIACGVKMGGIEKLLNSAAKAVTYYSKVQSALEDGYCIVPDFPVDIVAIRTNKERPSGTVETSGWKPTGIDQKPQSLAEGEGRYVGNQASAEWENIREKRDAQGKVYSEITIWEADEFQNVGLPVKFMKPRVLEATAHALAAKVFDEIGILPARPKKDPLVIGRIIDPKGARLSFLISWFVDSRDL